LKIDFRKSKIDLRKSQMRSVL